ncbi:TetR/AcrR family transcriptional regulator [Solimonas marina]|uniref:TetR/AcrR family transcriptional regulator n=1 Tax=Solimonas marina TaxID=2714601 RepID=A0A970B6M3_9GAMM|nr:TetR/AcrR family transcriptional regulator [Solimonas marina]NKF24637.1 TetR/AcrR family transcriptional regulator [Solimonas marina]
MVEANKLREDARENRERILEAARTAFAADPMVSLNAIAKTAGVGAGTLYRHFPNREALVLGVYRKEIDELAAQAARLLAKHPPLEAFRKWCDKLVQLGKVKHGIADLLHAAITDQDIQETYLPMLEAVRQLMNACKESGDIRSDASAEDVLTLVGLLWRIPPSPEGGARVKRILALVFRGLTTNESA